MGYKWYVYTWVLAEDFSAYHYKEIYGGQTLFKVIYYVLKLRIQGHSCIKIEYRP